MFLYIDRQTGDIVETGEAYDETLAVIYDVVDFGAPPELSENEPGFVYYDGDLGEIRGVSLVADPDMLARFAMVRAARDQVMRFMQGADDPSHWSVGYSNEDRTTPKLLPGSAKRVVVVKPLDDDWTELGTSDPLGHLRLVVTVARKEALAIFDLIVPKSVEIDHTGIEMLEFMFTRANDPGVVFGIAKVDLAQLCAEHKITVPLSAHMGNDDIAVYTHRVFANSGKIVEDYYQSKRVLPKGHFVDLSRFTTEKTPDTSLEATISDKVISFRIPDTKFQMYDRALDKLPVMLTKRFDPSFLLHATFISVSDLLSGKEPRIELPANLVGKSFDIVTPLFFINPVVRYE